MTIHDPYADYPDHLHPAKNFTPRQNTPRPSQDVRPPVIPRTLTDAEATQMAKEKLYDLLQVVVADTHPSLLLTVSREVLDRNEGKPTQRIEQKVEHSAKGKASELTNDQLLAELRMASVAGLLPQGMSMAENGNIVFDAEYQDVTP